MATEGGIIITPLTDELYKSALFENVGQAELDQLTDCLSPAIKTYSQGETIVLAGYPLKELGVVLSGTALAYAEKPDGERFLMRVMRPMSLFGELLAGSNQERVSPVSVYASSKSVAVAFIEYQKVITSCGNACVGHRTLLENMLKIVAQSYFTLFERLGLLREKSLRTRLTAYFSALEKGQGTGTVTLPFSKSTLAEYLFVNRSAMQKELAKMEADGLIAVSGRRIALKEIYKSY